VHNPVARRLVPTVTDVFADFSLVLLDEEDRILAGGWGVPVTWNGQVNDLPGAAHLPWDGREDSEFWDQSDSPPVRHTALLQAAPGADAAAQRGSSRRVRQRTHRAVWHSIAAVAVIAAARSR
jgi:hypothetical protein